MPFKADIRKETLKIINVLGAVIWPVAISISMPAFLHAIIIEKEFRLLENMKINGLQMRNYWFVQFIFNMTY